MSAGFGPDELIACYRRGVFPMAESREADQLFLVDPDWRGVFPLDRFHIPKRLARTVRADVFSVTIDEDFDGVVAGCAATKPGRDQTWINESIRSLYSALFKRGLVHTVECRREGKLVGGLYGVALGSAFFGESMFSTETDASKVALVHLVARLKAGGYTLLDAQFWNPHLAQFGLEQTPRAAFQKQLHAALRVEANFYALPFKSLGAQALQSIAQMS